MEKGIPCKWKSKESWITNTPEKIDFKIKTITRDKEGQYIIIKGSIQVEDITLEIYTHPTQEHFNVQGKC